MVIARYSIIPTLRTRIVSIYRRTFNSNYLSISNRNRLSQRPIQSSRLVETYRSKLPIQSPTLTAAASPSPHQPSKVTYITQPTMPSATAKPPSRHSKAGSGAPPPPPTPSAPPGTGPLPPPSWGLTHWVGETPREQPWSAANRRGEGGEEEEAVGTRG
ncbi:hypothetical protein F4775DRAFT_550490 [Biscogniauxia sp. FL1348]|nr:hypothetical protein F4775DRAFT_550490 [Biscogniauxia sp. FL1348]